MTDALSSDKSLDRPARVSQQLQESVDESLVEMKDGVWNVMDQTEERKPSRMSFLSATGTEVPVVFRAAIETDRLFHALNIGKCINSVCDA